MTTEEVSSFTSAYRTGTLGDLPLEVLSEVASNLDFVDILSLQQTSKKLRESTEAHVVWLALAKKYSARHFHRYRPEIGPIDDITTSELRAWTRKRLIVDNIWRAHSAREHSRVVPVRGGIVFKLVPGGRWLLVGHENGAVRYYDLDSKDPKLLPLTPRSSTAGEIINGVKDLEICVNEDAPRLEFKLVVRKSNNNDTSDIEQGWLHVWQINLEEDANSLTTKRLCTLPYSWGHNYSLALGRHLLVCVRSFFTGPSCVEVIWWKQCSATKDARIRFSIGKSRVDRVHVTSNEKILCIDREGIVRLYSTPEPDFTRGYHTVPPTQLENIDHKPIWSYSLPGGKPVYSSPVCYNGTTYRLVVSTGDGIWELVFSRGSNNNPKATRLLNVSRYWVKCAPGFCKAYAFHNEDGPGIRIGYNWEDEGGFPTVRYLNGEQENISPAHHPRAFDEETGRFVYLTDYEITIVDPLP